MLKRSEARMGHTIRISHSRLASACANMPYKIKKSEGVAHTEVERRIPPTEVVNPSLADGAIGVMELNTPVETENGKFDIETNTQTGIKTELLVEVVNMEDCLLGILRGV